MADPRKAHKGTWAEDLVERACVYYQRAGALALERIGTPMKQNAAGAAIYVRKSISDFIGVMPGGRSVALEVKSTMDAKGFALAPIRKAGHQLVFLRRHAGFGGLGVILFVWSPGPAVTASLVRFDDVETFLTSFPEPTVMPFSWLTDHGLRCPYNPRVAGIDFLGALHTLADRA